MPNALQLASKSVPALYDLRNEMDDIRIGLGCLLHTQGLHPAAIHCRSLVVPPIIQIQAAAWVGRGDDGDGSVAAVSQFRGYRGMHLTFILWVRHDRMVARPMGPGGD